MKRKKCFLLVLILAINMLIAIFLADYAFNNKYKIYPVEDKLYLDSKSSDKIVNKFNYDYILNTERSYCGKNNGQNLLLIAFVPISPNALDKRMLIRATWASSNYLLSSNGKIVFILGKSNDSEVNNKVKFEAATYGDIVQNDFMDTYYNLTIKTIMGFKWVSSFCQNAKYTLKVDDDVVVNVKYLTNYLKNLFDRDLHSKSSLLCMYHVNAPVCRDSASKFYLSRNEFSSDVFHPYCDGPAYIISTDLVPQLFNYAMYVRLIKFEDIYVGMLVRYTNANFIDMKTAYLSKVASQNLNNLVYLNYKMNSIFFLYAEDTKHFNVLFSLLIFKQNFS